jgi:hypothetical protein
VSAVQSHVRSLRCLRLPTVGQAHLMGPAVCAVGCVPVNTRHRSPPRRISNQQANLCGVNHRREHDCKHPPIGKVRLDSAAGCGVPLLVHLCGLDNRCCLDPRRPRPVPSSCVCVCVCVCVCGGGGGDMRGFMQKAYLSAQQKPRTSALECRLQIAVQCHV